jgi:hypothetical protein
MNDTLTVVPGKTDREIADDIRLRVLDALNLVLAIMDEVNAAGLVIGWRVERNGFGKNVATVIEINRPL